MAIKASMLCHVMPLQKHNTPQAAWEVAALNATQQTLPPDMWKYIEW
jgi:hypothetical protein